jgi:hypothetical protein
MKIEIVLGEGKSSIKLDGFDVANACAGASVDIRPNETRVHLILQPELLTIEGNAEASATLRRLFKS